MNLPIRYGALLSLLLISIFIVFNPSFEGTENSTSNEILNPVLMGSTLNTFSPIAFFSIPLVIIVHIVHIFQLNESEFMWQTGFRSGEIVSRWAATFYALAVILYSLGFYSGLLYTLDSAISLVLFGGITAFVGTYLLGLISAAITAILVRRMRTGAAA